MYSCENTSPVKGGEARATRLKDETSSSECASDGYVMKHSILVCRPLQTFIIMNSASINCDCEVILDGRDHGRNELEEKKQVHVHRQILSTISKPANIQHISEQRVFQRFQLQVYFMKICCNLRRTSMAPSPAPVLHTTELTNLFVLRRGSW